MKIFKIEHRQIFILDLGYKFIRQ